MPRTNLSLLQASTAVSSTPDLPTPREASSARAPSRPIRVAVAVSLLKIAVATVNSAMRTPLSYPPRTVAP